MKNLLSFNKPLLDAQLKLLFKKTKDPYDTFDYLHKAQVSSGISFIYFVNIGNYSRYDKNLPATNNQLKKLLQRINEYAFIGMHPSYFSNEIVEKFSQEKNLPIVEIK